MSKRPPIENLLAAILRDDRAKVKQMLRAIPELVTREVTRARLYRRGVFHWLYATDTALHLAAAGHRAEIARMLLSAGADVNATNRRGATPLHYAADGYVVSPEWNARQQVRTIEQLLKGGAAIAAQDKNGATPLHRAVRTRCAAVVKCLLAAGGDPVSKNKAGSTAFHLAVQNTGRGGTGAEQSIAAQRQIITLFLHHGVSPSIKNAAGKTVLESAQSNWIKKLLIATPARHTPRRRN